MISRLVQLSKEAVTNLLAAKLRSFLAVLGILVGTAAIVALISCGQLATEKALAEFKILGTDLLSVTVFHKSSGGEGSRDSVSLDAWRSLPESIHAIRRVAPYMTAYQPLSFQGNTVSAAIIGADESLADIIHIRLAEGHFVSFVESFERFCVLGHRVAEQLKQAGHYHLLGQQIRIGQVLYTVIGVAAPWQENGFFNEDVNNAVILPVSGMAQVTPNPEVNQAIFLIRKDSAIDTVIEDIKAAISQRAPGLGIFVRSAKQIVASMESQGRVFTLLLTVIGGISLLVGGIGVMNVMLVSVSERKKEIGIRKAVGARNREIQQLFLVEGILLSLSGGFAGVFLGVGLTWIIAHFSHWPFTLYLTPPLIGFLISTLTGVFFGFYPAYRAARLEPMASLRAAV